MNQGHYTYPILSIQKHFNMFFVNWAEEWVKKDLWKKTGPLKTTWSKMSFYSSISYIKWPQKAIEFIKTYAFILNWYAFMRKCCRVQKWVWKDHNYENDLILLFFETTQKTGWIRELIFRESMLVGWTLAYINCCWVRKCVLIVSFCWRSILKIL